MQIPTAARFAPAKYRLQPASIGAASCSKTDGRVRKHLQVTGNAFEEWGAQPPLTQSNTCALLNNLRARLDTCTCCKRSARPASGGGRQGGAWRAGAVQKQVFLNTKPQREVGNAMVGAADTAAALAQAPFRVKRMPRAGGCVNRMDLLRRLHRGKVCDCLICDCQSLVLAQLVHVCVLFSPRCRQTPAPVAEPALLGRHVLRASQSRPFHKPASSGCNRECQHATARAAVWAPGTVDQRCK